MDGEATRVATEDLLAQAPIIQNVMDAPADHPLSRQREVTAPQLPVLENGCRTECARAGVARRMLRAFDDVNGHCDVGVGPSGDLP